MARCVFERQSRDGPAGGRVSIGRAVALEISHDQQRVTLSLAVGYHAVPGPAWDRLGQGVGLREPDIGAGGHLLSHGPETHHRRAHFGCGEGLMVHPLTDYVVGFNGIERSTKRQTDGDPKVFKVFAKMFAVDQGAVI